MNGHLCFTKKHETQALNIPKPDSFSPFVAARQILRDFHCLLPFVRAQGSLRIQMVFYQECRTCSQRITQRSKRREPYPVEAQPEALLCFASECQVWLIWMGTSNCLLPNLILKDRKQRKEKEKRCKHFTCFSDVHIHVQKVMELLLCHTVFTLRFLRYHLPGSRLGMGSRLRRGAGHWLVGVDALLRCKGSWWSIVLILLFNRWMETFWKLMSRGGHPVPWEGSLTGSTGRIPVWCICVINTRSCRSLNKTWLWYRRALEVSWRLEVWVKYTTRETMSSRFHL